MSKQEVIICQHFNTELSQKLSAHSYDKIFILTDEHTFRLCLPLLQDIALLKDAEQIVRNSSRSLCYNTSLCTLQCRWK